MKIQLKRSNVLDGGSAKKPTAQQMEYGELAVNYNAADPTIFIKDDSGTIIPIAGDSHILNLIQENQQIIVSPTPPTTPAPINGDLWLDMDQCPPVLYVWTDCQTAGGEWLPIGGGGADGIDFVARIEDDGTALGNTPGHVLTALADNITGGTAPVETSYRWNRGNIFVGDGKTQNLTSQDVGNIMSCEVTVAEPDGSGAVTRTAVYGKVIELAGTIDTPEVLAPADGAGSGDARYLISDTIVDVEGGGIDVCETELISNVGNQTIVWANEASGGWISGSGSPAVVFDGVTTGLEHSWIPSDVPNGSEFGLFGFDLLNPISPLKSAKFWLGHQSRSIQMTEPLKFTFSDGSTYQFTVQELVNAGLETATGDYVYEPNLLDLTYAWGSDLTNKSLTRIDASISGSFRGIFLSGIEIDGRLLLNNTIWHTLRFPGNNNFDCFEPGDVVQDPDVKIISKDAEAVPPTITVDGGEWTGSDGSGTPGEQTTLVKETPYDTKLTVDSAKDLADFIADTGMVMSDGTPAGGAYERKGYKLVTTDIESVEDPKISGVHFIPEVGLSTGSIGNLTNETWETWFNIDKDSNFGGTNIACFWSQKNNSTHAGTDVVIQWTADAIQAVDNNSNIHSIPFVRDGKWHHYALTKAADNTVKVYLDGELKHTGVSWSHSNTVEHQIGVRQGTVKGYFEGYMSNMRLSNTVRYTENFTPLKEDFVSDANTLYLLFQGENPDYKIDHSGKRTFTQIGTGNMEVGKDFGPSAGEITLTFPGDVSTNPDLRYFKQGDVVQEGDPALGSKYGSNSQNLQVVDPDTITFTESSLGSPPNGAVNSYSMYADFYHPVKATFGSRVSGTNSFQMLMYWNGDNWIVDAKYQGSINTNEGTWMKGVNKSRYWLSVRTNSTSFHSKNIGDIVSQQGHNITLTDNYGASNFFFTASSDAQPDVTVISTGYPDSNTMTVDGGEWYADPNKGGDGSGDSDGDTHVEYQTYGGEGEIVSVNTDDNTLLIANTGDRDNRWIANDNKAGTDFYVAGGSIVDEPLLTADVELLSSLFATTPDGADSLKNIVWELNGATQDAGLSNPYKPTLSTDTTYTVRVKHQGNSLPDSAWSTSTTFTTGATRNLYTYYQDRIAALISRIETLEAGE